VLCPISCDTLSEQRVETAHQTNSDLARDMIEEPQGSVFNRSSSSAQSLWQLRKA
jgi:hypothetical protein